MNSINDDRLFEEAAKQYGLSRLSDNMFSPDRFGSILDQVKSRAVRRIDAFRMGVKLTRDMSKLIFDYTDEPLLNACAFDYNDLHFIALSGYGIASIHHAMFRLLSSPYILEEIGHCDKEDGNIPFVPLSNNFRTIVYHLTNSSITMGNYIPKDSTRELTARAMAQLAADFVIAHEFRHHQAGHVEYWQNICGQPFIRELNTGIDESSLSIISQALEMDADCYAIKTILHWSLEMVAKPADYTEGWSIAFPDAKRAAFLSMLSAYIVFKLFDLVGNPPESWDNLSHPPPALRNSMMIATVLECFKRWNRLDLYDWFPECIPRLIEVGEKQLGLITNSEPKKEALRRIYGSEGQTHVSRILAAWSQVETPLSVYSHVSFD
jgi:hypothetical protein